MKLIAVGKIKKKFLKEGIEKYLKRINLEIIEIKDNTVKKEGTLILSKIKSDFTIALSEEGKEFDSTEFASFIKNKNPTFIIGGPDGLSQEVKKNSNIIVSLSKMTFTHEMARLFLIEQIYRAKTIMENKSYHR